MGSTRKLEINLGETVKEMKFIPLSPVEAKPTNIASNPDDICPMSVSNAVEVMTTSPSQNEEIHSNHSILPKKDPPEDKTTAVIAVMRGKPKDGYHRHCSNKHYKQTLVQVLLESGSDSNLVFVNKDKPMLLPSLRRLVPQSWNTSNGMFQTKHKARMIELNFFEYSSKRFLVEPDVVEYSENNRPHYDLILGTKTMKKLGNILDIKAKMITIDEVILPNAKHQSSARC